MSNPGGPAWGGPASDVRSLRAEVGRLRRALEQHEREHQAADELREKQAEERARLRRQTRRYWITTMAAVIGSNLATLFLLAAHVKA